MVTTDRLWIVHTESSCGWGGQEIRIISEATGLLARGHRITLICPPFAPLAAAAEKAGLSVERLPIARKNLKGLYSLRRWLTSHPEISVINTHSSTDSWLVAMARLGHGMSPPIVRTRHVSTHVKNNFSARWLYRRAASHIVTAGEALREQLHREVGIPITRITSVPTGIDLEQFSPRPQKTAREMLDLDPARHYLGIVATLRNWKGHAYLLEAFASLSGKFPDWDLLIVGDGPQRKNLERLMAASELNDRVVMPGNRDDVERWLAAMDLFVLPSYGEEGVSQSVMQAMACGLPVVSTTVGATHEAVASGETGTLVRPHDVNQLQAALERFMANEQLRRKFGDAGRARAVRLFGTDLMLDAMENVFSQVLRGRH